MTIKEAKNIKVGDFVKIINTHKDKKTDNDRCIWVVVGTSEYVRDRQPIMIFDIRLVKGTYVRWEKNEIINEGEVINRTNRALKKVRIKIEEA
jgi:hypothetical protein